MKLLTAAWRIHARERRRKKPQEGRDPKCVGRHGIGHAVRSLAALTRRSAGARASECGHACERRRKEPQEGRDPKCEGRHGIGHVRIRADACARNWRAYRHALSIEGRIERDSVKNELFLFRPTISAYTITQLHNYTITSDRDHICVVVSALVFPNSALPTQ